MKKLMRLLCATMLLVSFAACTEKENLNNDTPSGDDNNYSAMLLGRWQVLSMSVDGQDMTPEHMQLLFINGGSGLMDGRYSLISSTAAAATWAPARAPSSPATTS